MGAKTGIISHCCFCGNGLKEQPYASMRIGKECFDDHWIYRKDNLGSMTDLLELQEVFGNKVAYKESLAKTIDPKYQEEFSKKLTDDHKLVAKMEKRDIILKTALPYIKQHVRIYNLIEQVEVKINQISLDNINKMKAQVNIVLSLCLNELKILKEKENSLNNKTSGLIDFINDEESHIKKLEQKIMDILNQRE